MWKEHTRDIFYDYVDHLHRKDEENRAASFNNLETFSKRIHERDK